MQGTETKLELHQSQLAMLLKCGLQFEFRYVKGIKIPPSAWFTVGRAVDVAVSANLTQKIETKADLRADDVVDACATEFDREAPDTEWGDEDKGEQKDVAIQCVKAHHKKIAPLIQPTTVQEKFVLETDAGFHLGGTIDVTTEHGVRDTKTSSKSYSKTAVHRALQPAIYDLAFESLRGRKAKSFAYDVLKKPTKTMPAVAEVIEAPVTALDRQFFFDTAVTAKKIIDSGTFLPAPEGAYWCAPKYCGYWNLCKGKK